MKKKKICIVMIICLVILVSACGYNENDEADEDMSIQVNAVRKSEDANSIEMNQMKKCKLGRVRI